MSSPVLNAMALYRTTLMKHQFANNAFQAWDNMMAGANQAGGPGTVTPHGSVSPTFGRMQALNEAGALHNWMMYNAADIMQQAVLNNIARENQQRAERIKAGYLYA